MRFSIAATITVLCGISSADDGTLCRRDVVRDANMGWYFSKPGDTWKGIADMFDMKVDLLKNKNPWYPQKAGQEPPPDHNIYVTCSRRRTAKRDTNNASYAWYTVTSLIDTWTEIANDFMDDTDMMAIRSNLWRSSIWDQKTGVGKKLKVKWHRVCKKHHDLNPLFGTYTTVEGDKAEDIINEFDLSPQEFITLNKLDKGNNKQGINDLKPGLDLVIKCFTKKYGPGH